VSLVHFARANLALTSHSAFVRFSPNSFDVRVVALRDIEVGEEITISCMEVPTFKIFADRVG
jgi:hypothetical protein